MEKQMVFHVLGIEETKDEEKLQEAYRAHLREVNPEDDPEGFKRLREAYEAAMSLAREPEDTEERPKDEVDFWIDRVNETYHNINTRFQEEAWKEVFADPAWEGLDTSFVARERFIAWLMDHVHLPQEIWKVIDREVQITGDREELQKTFPKNFLNYVQYQVENETFFCYKWFRADALDEESIEVDAYLEQYYQIKRELDQKAAGMEPEWEDGEDEEAEKAAGGEADAKFFRHVLQKIKDLRAFELYHPYEDVERARLYKLEGKTEEQNQIADRLLADYPEDCYVLIHMGRARYDAGRKDEAKELWERLIEECPQSIPAREGLAQIALEEKDFQRAKDLSIEILDIQSNMENAQALMKEANEGLIPQFLARDLNAQDTLELGWCYFQNERLDEAVELLSKFSWDEECEYGYYNLYGRVLFTKGDYETARPFLSRWLELILATEDDGSEESKKRFDRLSLAYYMNGCSAGEMKEYPVALEYLHKAAETSDEFYERLSYQVYEAKLLVESEQYEQAVDLCDHILEEDEGYYPAYLQRQEAYFELHNGQQVVDDYHHAIEIYAGYHRPYLLAEKVFFFYRQYEDAKHVLEVARENNVELSDEMRLFEVKILRNLAESDEARKEPLAICAELLERIKDEDTDIEDKSEVEYETGLLHWDNNEFKEAKEHILTAMAQNPERDQYRMIYGDILRDEGKPEEALAEYGKAEREFEGNPRLYYCKGRCYEDMDEPEKAREQYERVVGIDLDYMDVNERLADVCQTIYNTYCRKKDFERALGYISRQIQTDENCYYLVHRGLLLMDALLIDDAIADYKRALELVPDDWAAYNNMGYSYKIKGEFELGKEMLKKAVECMKPERPNLLPYSNMADCYEIQGDYQGAIDCYRKDLEMFPDHYQFWGEIGDMAFYMGDYKQALEAYRQAEIVSGERAISYAVEMGDVYLAKGQRLKALQLYWKDVLKTKFKDTQALSDLGRRYMEYLRNYRMAIYIYKKALRTVESERDGWNYERNIAKCYYRLHQYDKAAEHGKRALELLLHGYTEEDYVSYPPVRPARLGYVATCYLYMGENEKAFDYLRQMQEGYRCKYCRNRGCYEAHLFRGMYYEVQGDREKALEEYHKGYELNRFDEELNGSLLVLEGKKQ